MKNKGGRDVVLEQFDTFTYEGKLMPTYIEIKQHETHALLQISDEFNFLERIAFSDPYTRDKTEEFGFDQIEEVFKRKYVPIPDKRTIEAAYLTQDGFFVIVDSSAYKYSYDTIKCHYGNLNTDFKVGTISNFKRYKDGGTTSFDFELDGVKHEYYSPTSFTPEKASTWNGIEMKPIDKEQIDSIAKYIGIDLAPEIRKR